MDVVRIDGVQTVTLAAGVPLVAYVVAALGKDALRLPSRWLPALALLLGVAWTSALTVAGYPSVGDAMGRFPVVVLHGVLIGQAASGARSWYRAYRPAESADASMAEPPADPIAAPPAGSTR